MGGFLGIGGSSQKTDRGRELGGWNGEWNVFNTGMPLANNLSTSGQTTTGQGLDKINSVSDFWKSILSGNRTATQTAAAPMVNAVTDQADAQRRQQAAMGTSRGGGAVGSNIQAQTAANKQINDAIFGVLPAAANAEADIGKTVAGVGYQQMIQSLQAYGLSLDAARAIVDSSIQSRPQSDAINQRTQQQAGSFVGTVLKAIGI